MKLTQSTLISILKEKKDAYPHKITQIRIKETHISWILLTGKYAYKIKKGLKFGKVLDFSTLALRKKFCQKEIILNKILCKQMYQKVVKIIQDEKGNLKIVSLHDKGKPLEYAVKMLEIPQKFRMDNLIVAAHVNTKTIDNLTDILVKFHKRTPTSVKIKKFGQPGFILKKVQENFRTLSKLSKINSKYERKLVSFIGNNKELFKTRIKFNKIRDIHGDLYLGNIFIVKNKFYLYDRLEFNDSLRYADVAEDVAHFSMDLDLHKKEKLRKHFISKYIKKSKDFELIKLVYFFMCFKACIRAKVSIFRAKNEPMRKKRKSQLSEAKKHFVLAESYLDLF